MASGKSLIVVSRAMMPLLIVEFLIGMYVSLFTVFPTPSSTENPMQQMFTGSSLLLTVHVVVGFLILLVAAVLLVLVAVLKQRRVSLIASLGLVAVMTSILTGMAFVLGGYSDNVLSYFMSVGFIFSFVLYGALAGIANTSLQSG